MTWIKSSLWCKLSTFIAVRRWPCCILVFYGLIGLMILEGNLLMLQPESVSAKEDVPRLVKDNTTEADIRFQFGEKINVSTIVLEAIQGKDIASEFAVAAKEALYLPDDGGPDYDIEAIAYSVKLITCSNPQSGEKVGQLPIVSEELLALTHFSGEAAGKDEADSEIWCLAYLYAARQYFNHEILESCSQNWQVANTPMNRALDIRTKKTPCIAVFSTKPSIKQVAAFIETTDFGNNSVIEYTDYAKRISEKTLLVHVAPAFRELIPQFKADLREPIRSERINQYNTQWKRLENQRARKDGLIDGPYIPVPDVVPNFTN